MCKEYNVYLNPDILFLIDQICKQIQMLMLIARTGRGIKISTAKGTQMRRTFLPDLSIDFNQENQLLKNEIE